MFKYIADIIGKISVTQRVMALSLLLSSIIILTLGPSLLDSMTQDNEELNIKVNRQRTQIIQLSNELDSLNYLIIRNQRECTNRIIEREEEIYNDLDRLEKMIKYKNNKINNVIIDTVVSASYTIPKTGNVDEMLNGLSIIKKDIKNHVNDCKENGK
jgi:TolA-binding protein